ncbi:MAG: lysozyme inhibitor LprI family protein [Sideroxydans sp.]|nr:lysozyme inhibitor LprI family protein [Sideroxydans sp.]
MTSNKLLFSGLLLCGFMQVAAADDAALSKQFSACMERSGGATADMLDCIAAEKKLQDARLNKAYKEVVAQLPPPRKKQLQDAQRAWLKYRDANCNFYADPEGGTMATVNSNDCVMSTTASRAKELEGFME